MAELKTRPNDGDIEAFLTAVEPARRAEDARQVMQIMADITQSEPRIWGSSIIGFGSYRYTYKDGSKREWMLTGVSPRKASLSVYIMPGFKPFADEMAKLGKFKTGASCLYITRLENIDQAVLRDLIEKSVDWMRAKYPTS